MNDQSGMRQSEGDAWRTPQVAGSNCLESVNPQYTGSQVLASGGVAQAARRDAGVMVSRDDEWAVLLRRLGETSSGRDILAKLKGVSFCTGAVVAAVALPCTVCGS